jgi:alkylation response protein AidB-like acyl-CoA dehydrogenase
VADGFNVVAVRVAHEGAVVIGVVLGPDACFLEDLGVSAHRHAEGWEKIVDFEIPADLADYLGELDVFIEREIRPLEQQDDNIPFFDYRREDARTDWDRGGLPNRQWEELLAGARRRADAAGHYRYAFPAEYGGREGTNLGMAVIREHLAAKGLGLHCDLWTFNMPTDHARVSFHDVRVPEIFGGEGRGLQVVQHFFNENRIRQAASSLGAAQYCVNESVAYAKERKPFGQPLAANQAIQFPLVELQTQCEMLRALIHKTAWLMDTHGPFSASDKVSMCNYWANRLCCEAADRAMQVHGGLGYSRHKPFEHIYRHHRRYRITEGTEEIQMRRVAGYMFGYMRQRAPKGVTES